MTDTAIAGDTPKAKTVALPSLRTVHKLAGLTALAWLTVLGLTGWILDHHAWRWSHQWTVPSEITSTPINRLVRGTVMRNIIADAADPNRYIGGSERGLWWTADAGKTWNDAIWEGAGGLPQTYDLVAGPNGDLNHVWAATDDGIWIIKDNGIRAVPFALRGQQITSLTAGSAPDELAGVVNESRLFRLNAAAPGNVTWTDLSNVEVSGLPDSVLLNRFALELHVGVGFLPQPWSTIVNDYGGIAIAILSLTGLFFWWLPRRWRGHSPKGELKSRQKILRWLYRGHGPVIGLLAIVPILYVSVTGIMVDHIQELIDYSKDVHLSRDMLPPLYQYKNLSHEISDIVAFPDDPAHMIAASRFGILESRDGGKFWAVDKQLPESLGSDGGRFNVFRVGEMIFLGVGSIGQFYRHQDSNSWTQLKVDGPPLAITSASQRDGTWYIKNSRAIYAGSLDGTFTDTKIAYPPLTGTTFFLFLADIHTGNLISTHWRWVNDLVALLAIALVLSGPVLWWRRKWM